MRNIAFAATMLLGLSCHPGQADDYDRRSRQLANAASNTWEQVIKPKFVRVMSRDERETLDSIDFRFLPGGGVFDVFAGRDDNGQAIVVMSGAFVAYQEAALNAILVSNHFEIPDQLVPYFDDAWEAAVRNSARLRSHLPALMIPDFATYAHLDRQALADYTSSSQFDSRLMALRIGSLAYVLGHEIGHHYHGDRGHVSNSEQVDREIAADQYSMTLMMNAGLSPLAAIPVMMFYHESGGDSLHPPPTCRLVAFLKRGLPAMMRDEDFRRYTHSHPAEMSQFKATRAYMDDHSDEIVRDCGSWVAE